jgi:putative acetyltransferase
LRTVRPGDAGAVRTVLVSAFGGAAEADLVDRVQNDLVVALVAERSNGNLAGYVAFPRLSIESPAVDQDLPNVPAVALAPLAVAADFGRRGVGAALVRRGLALLAERNEQIVFVLGPATYYTRFGFDADAAASFRSRYAGPHFMALRLTPAAPSNGIIRYPAAFDQLR